MNNIDPRTEPCGTMHVNIRRRQRVVNLHGMITYFL